MDRTSHHKEALTALNALNKAHAMQNQKVIQLYYICEWLRVIKESSTFSYGGTSTLLYDTLCRLFVVDVPEAEASLQEYHFDKQTKLIRGLLAKKKILVKQLSSDSLSKLPFDILAFALAAALAGELADELTNRFADELTDAPTEDARELDNPVSIEMATFVFIASEKLLDVVIAKLVAAYDVERATLATTSAAVNAARAVYAASK